MYLILIVFLFPLFFLSYSATLAKSAHFSYDIH